MEIELGSLLEYIQRFGKSESAARVSLSRMVKSNILINKNKKDQVFYQLTREGLYNINIWNRGVERFFKRYELRNKTWDNKWTTITMINFKKSGEENQFVIENLLELGYKEIDNNVWLSPYYLEDEIKKLTVDYGINYFITRGDIVTNIDQADFLDQIFGLNSLKKDYRQLIKDIKNMRQKIKEQTVKEGDLLPVLFKLGWSYYDIIIEDPVLPICVLGDWIGDKAVEEMSDFRDYLVVNVSNYFKSRSKKKYD